MDRPDIGIFFGRPERSHLLAEKLRARGFRVTLYNDRGLPGTYKTLGHSFVPALLGLLSSQHHVYVTPLSFIPSLCLSLNRVLRRRPCVFNATGLKSATYRERSRKWPLRRTAERWLYPALMRLVMAGASRVVCNSRYLQERLASQFPQHGHKIVTIYNGIEFERFGSGRPVALDGIFQSAPKLLAVMTWNYEGKASGAHLLIDAMGPITEKCPDARLIIAAKIGHERHARQIEDYLAKKPWRQSVQTLYNQTNIPDVLASADLFVYATPPESNDSLPRAVLEAHAAGLPIVATATAGCPEVVQDSATGFVVPYDAEALAQRVVELLADPNQREEFGRRGRERVRELFNWDRMGEAYANLFLDLVCDSGVVLKPKAAHAPETKTPNAGLPRGRV